MSESLLEQARAAIDQVDLSAAERVWTTASRSARPAAGCNTNSASQLNPDEVKSLDAAHVHRARARAAHAAYDEKEAEFPGPGRAVPLHRPRRQGQKRYDRDQLVAWARQRFHIELNVDDLRNMQREEIQQMLVEYSKQALAQANQTLAEAHQQVVKIFGDDSDSDATVGAATGGNGALSSLTEWLRDRMDVNITPDAIAELDRDELEKKLNGAVEDRYRPEIRRLERDVVLYVLDTMWKDHLLAMDHLRSSVGLRGYAQVDPKVEYKREGMRTFEQMWTSLGERVTDMIFRMEELDEGFVGSTWTESQATHDSPAPNTAMMTSDQQTAVDNSDAPAKIEPIRNRGEHVGRNDPCPCGSGKKFKNCHMRNGGNRT